MLLRMQRLRYTEWRETKGLILRHVGGFSPKKNRYSPKNLKQVHTALPSITFNLEKKNARYLTSLNVIPRAFGTCPCGYIECICSDFFAKRMNKKSKIKKLMIDGFDFTLLYCFLHSQLTARAFWSDEIFSGQAGVFCTMQKKSDFYSSVFFSRRWFVSQKSFTTSLYTFSLLSSGRSSSSLKHDSAFCTTTTTHKSTKERERDDGFFFFFFVFFFFVLSCARLSSRTTTTSQFGVVGVKENDGEAREDSQEEERF